MEFCFIVVLVHFFTNIPNFLLEIFAFIMNTDAGTFAVQLKIHEKRPIIPEPAVLFK